MYTISTPVPAGGINIELLQQELRIEFADQYLNCGEPDPGYPITFTLLYEGVDDQARFEAVVAAHVATNQTPEQRDSAQQTLDFSELKANVNTAVEQGNAGLTQIDSDLSDLAAATTLTAVRPIVENLLNRQRKTIQFLLWLIRVLRWYVGYSLSNGT